MTAPPTPPPARPCEERMLPPRAEHLARITTRRVFGTQDWPLFSYQDALQVARVAGVLAIRSYNPARGTPETWLIEKMRRALMEAMRQRANGATRTRNGPNLQFVSFEAWIDAEVDEAEPRRIVEALIDPRNDYAAVDTALECASTLRVLRWLTPRESAVLRAYYLEDVTHKVIAGRLGLSESRIHQIHRQGLERARAMLEAGG